jgi:EAL domain-containing protein (putative c-di-GMP-specific phosphodiesterase class I)
VDVTSLPDLSDRAWLRVDSQPIVCLSDGRVAAEELLVRIVEGEGAAIPPLAFIPAAERCGVMPTIDRYAIERAAELASSGRSVHVNLSATTIAQPGLFDDIIGALHRHGARPEQITFEITETAAAADLSKASHLATRLAARGFRIALDDFGSGWGAFRYLKALPVSVIKIDREFIRDVASNERALTLVRGIVGLARLVGHETIAEGVEDELTFVLLRSVGVDYAQGFHVGRPQPTD